MRPGHLQVLLFQPEIPQNAGTIGRLAAATASRLHLIRPFGFDDSDRQLKRAGLDYWPFLDLEIHDDIEPLLVKFLPKVAFLSKKSSRPYTEIAEDVDLLVFGRETTGLPEAFHQKYSQYFYQIPMFHSGVRSINLANAVSIVLYEQMRKRKLFQNDSCTP